MFRCSCSCSCVRSARPEKPHLSKQILSPDKQPNESRARARAGWPDGDGDGDGDADGDGDLDGDLDGDGDAEGDADELEPEREGEKCERPETGRPPPSLSALRISHLSWLGRDISELSARRFLLPHSKAVDEPSETTG